MAQVSDDGLFWKARYDALVTRWNAQQDFSEIRRERDDLRTRVQVLERTHAALFRVLSEAVPGGGGERNG